MPKPARSKGVFTGEVCELTNCESLKRVLAPLLRAGFCIFGNPKTFLQPMQLGTRKESRWQLSQRAK